MMKERGMIYLKGKESVFTNVLLVIATLVFIVPIILIFSLRFIYKIVQNAKESILVQTQTDSNLNKVY